MKNVLVISGQYNYTVNVVDEESADLVYALNSFNPMMKAIERLWWKLKLPWFSIFFSFKGIDLKKYDLIVMFECDYPIQIVEYIQKKNPKCMLVYWLWNTIDKMHIGKGYALPDEIKKLSQKDVDVYSFDIHDCEKNKFKYNNQLGIRYKLESRDSDYDLFFCGLDKNRIDLIREIDRNFDNEGLHFKCLLFPNNTKLYSKEDEKYLSNDMLAYKDVIRYEQSCKCILDLVQDGQMGLTWRPLEAMFYEKKLITNYKDIKRYDFYKKENIFIIGEDNWGRIKEFINSKYEDVSEKIIMKYEWNGWLKNIKNNN